MQGIALLQSLAKTYPDVTVVAVTKYMDESQIKYLLGGGCSHLAEARLVVAKKKFEHLKEYNFSKHFIGNIQSREIGELVRVFDVIQSVGSLRHMQKIDVNAGTINKMQDVFLQLNLTGEERKHGFLLSSPESIDAFARDLAIIQGLENLCVRGFMCMGKRDDPDITAQVFLRLRSLAKQHGYNEVSMGMSDDYEIALKCGSTMLRLGRVLEG